MNENTINLPISASKERLVLKNRIFSIQHESEFEELALRVFRFQATYNKVYHSWLKALNVDPNAVKSSDEIPFLPIEFFKHHSVRSGTASAQIEFKSSGTTSTGNSIHYIYDTELYDKSILKGFELAYGNPDEYEVVALLPSYLERADSSLVYMVRKLMKNAQEDRFFLNNYKALHDLLNRLARDEKKVWLIGVSFALIDFSFTQPAVWDNLTVIETGGMKGRRKEMVREELHKEIQKNWPVKSIHSEYGMTELLSQAWMKEEGKFVCPPWMKVSIRDSSDPFSSLPAGKTGGINVIDLANLDSCSFIATSDLGKRFNDGSFEVLGRFDNSDIRGCNLLSEL